MGSKAKSDARWDLRRTERGGVSAGWTSLNAFYRCMRFGYWSRLHAGAGIKLPQGPPDAAPLYGQLWHAGYRALWKQVSLKDALLAHLDAEELSAEMYLMLTDEVQRDLDWYWGQERSDARLTVLACEEELSVDIGRHTLRGTPDLVGREETGSIVIPDHKTFGVLSYTKTGSPRIELTPRDTTIIKYQASRQFPFYCSLWSAKHPAQPCYDALLNMVPSHVTAVLGVLNERSGNVAMPKVHRIDLEPFAPSYLEEIRAQALALCDIIAAWWDSNGTWPPPKEGIALANALTIFRETDAACVGYGGGLCQYYDLCRGDAELRENLFAEAFEEKEIG